MQGRSLRMTIYIAAGAIALLLGALLWYSHSFGPPSEDTAKRDVVITPDESMESIAAELKNRGLIRSEWAFRIAYLGAAAGRGVRPGGYEITPSMDVWTVASTLTRSPYLSWVVIPPGVRVEQVGDLLANALSWTNQERAEWEALATSTPGYGEGTFYPDTYLIPSDQPPDQVLGRLHDRYVQALLPYMNEAAQKKVKWSSVLTIASLIEREAAGPDMKLISGIIWNRLERNMALQIDATLQYVKGNDDTGWWPVVKSEDKYLESPFNTYQNAGLPPHPIADSALAAVDAALNPEETKCLYYLHDNRGQIHCSANYAGQLSNVNKYLK